MTLQRTGRALEVVPWPEFPVNEGALCRKGWTATGLRGNRERLTTPLVRDRATGDLRAAGWDEALDLVASQLLDLRKTHGSDSVAVFGGGGLTNEKAYQLGKFARVALGTSQIDYNGRWCMSSAASAANQAFGIDRGCRSRWRTSSRPTCSSSSGPTSPRRCPRPHGISTGCASAVAGSW